MNKLSNNIYLSCVLAAVTALSTFSPASLRAADTPNIAKSPATQMARVLKQGLWVWDPKIILVAEEQDKLLDFAQRQEMNLLLVETHWEPGTLEDGALVMAMPEMYVRLIRQAAKRGIKIEALSGWRDWGMKSKWQRPLAMTNSIIAFNKKYGPETQFIGIHLDIEPYLLPEWKTDARYQMMQENLELLEQIRAKLTAEAPGMTLAVDIPMWYDRRISPENSCVVEYRGVTKNFHQHIQDITDYVGIMSYVRRGTGPGSIQTAIENEMNYARAQGKYVLGGMETKQLLKEPSATFYGLPPERFVKEKNAVEEALKEDPAFGGMLVHQYPAMRNLLEQPIAETTAPK